MSRRFLFVLVEGGGNVPPVLGLAKRMAARGHHVRVLSDPALVPDARSLGLELVPFVHAPHQNLRSREHDRLRDWAVGSSLGQLSRITGEVMFGPAHKYALDVLAELARFPADVVVVDYMIPGAAIGAEKAGVPSAILMHTPYALPAPGCPPFGLGLTPGRTVLTRARDRVLAALTAWWFNRLGLKPINDARAALGLPLLRTVYEQITHAERVLVMTAPGFDFVSRARLPDSVRYVGPGLDDPTWTTPYSLPAASPDAPLVLVGLGSTFQNQQALTQRVVDALASLPVRGLVTLGNVFEPSEFTAPSNVTVVRSAAHSALLPRARLVVAHGGHGTVIKALGHGVPVLCLPLGRDQRDNAARVELAGAGLRLSPSASANTIRSALARLLNEPTFRAAASGLADEIERYARDDASVRELEQLAGASVTRAVA